MEGLYQGFYSGLLRGNHNDSIRGFPKVSTKKFCKAFKVSDASSARFERLGTRSTLLEGSLVVRSRVICPLILVTSMVTLNPKP